MPSPITEEIPPKSSKGELILELFLFAEMVAVETNWLGKNTENKDEEHKIIIE